MRHAYVLPSLAYWPDAQQRSRIFTGTGNGCVFSAQRIFWEFAFLPKGEPRQTPRSYRPATLESEMRVKAISVIYDPTIGIMYEGSYVSSKFIFDLVGPERA
jgi:hypothetical protein